MRREDDVLISVAQAAALLDVDPATVWRYITAESDPLPAEKVGRAYALWQSDVLEFSGKPRRGRGRPPRRPRADDPA